MTIGSVRLIAFNPNDECVLQAVSTTDYVKSIIITTGMSDKSSEVRQ